MPDMDEITKIANMVAGELGYEVKKIFFKGEYGRKILSVTINKEGGVTVKDCETFSKRMGLALDDMDIIRKKYYLEVSSPGIE